MKHDPEIYRTVDTDGIDDCAECCFGNVCMIACTLPKGIHYEEREYL